MISKKGQAMNITVDIPITMRAVARHVVVNRLETDLLMALELEVRAYAEDKHPVESGFYWTLAAELGALREWIESRGEL